ncbi:MAG TPA: hypothetical protein VFD83_02230 [Candidatus Polarisedimenticolia bacterium]|nr:hypothetical protein [Candidatus Polarisedimenticolia bacterium]
MNSRSLRRARARNRLHAFTRRLIMLTMAVTAIWIVSLHDQGNARTGDFTSSIFEPATTSDLANTY